MRRSREFVRPDQLTGVLRAGYGPGRRLAGLTRLRGGSKKGVYRLTFEDGGGAVLYVWSAEENFWPAAAGAGPDTADPFSDASGLGLFTAARSRLDAVGVRTPRLVYADGSHTHYPADLAIVEDVPGGTLEHLLDTDPAAAGRPLAELAGALAAMRACVSPRLGKVAPVDAGTVTGGAAVTAAGVALSAARAHLGEAAGRVPEIGAVASRLDELLASLAAAVPPRDGYGLVHGELGPDHVLVDRDGHAVLIDIEGLMFFDVEWEHVFLRIRFADHYPALRADGLDETRLRLYALAQHLSLVAGPLRIADGDFPDRDVMRDIAAAHTRRVLAFVQER